jgi:uncharacterized protein (DUF1499 family)
MTLFLSLLALIVIVPLALVYLPGHKARLESLLKVPPLQQVDFATLRKIAKPNQFLVCPNGVCTETPDLVARTYPVDAATLAAAFDNIARAKPDVAERGRDAAAQKVDYVQRTARMRYPDLITVQFFDRGANQSSLAVYSRSIFGYSDRGVNKARITAWLGELDTALGHAPN